MSQSPSSFRRPTPEGLASFLDAVHRGRGSEETEALALWLFEQIPELRELRRSMDEETSIGVRRLDLLKLLFVVSGRTGWPEGEAVARRLIARVEGAREHLERLDQMAAEIGGRRAHEGWVEAVLALHQELDRLLASPDWRDPAEVLDPGGELGVDVPRLIKLGAARLASCQDPDTRDRLGSVLDRLADSSSPKACR